MPRYYSGMYTLAHKRALLGRADRYTVFLEIPNRSYFLGVAKLAQKCLLQEKLITTSIRLK